MCILEVDFLNMICSTRKNANTSFNEKMVMLPFAVNSAQFVLKSFLNVATLKINPTW
jgi:hypothetical protein